jgi:hypothetical protein
MANCKMPVLLAYGMMIYVGASIGYLIKTRSYGTPFKDSLTPAQMAIKQESARQRKEAFLSSALVTAVMIAIKRPFRNCEHCVPCDDCEKCNVVQNK